MIAARYFFGMAGFLLLGTAECAAQSVSGSVGPTEYRSIFDSKYDGNTVSTMGWMNKTPLPAPSGEPDCNDPFHAHCHQICVKIDKKQFQIPSSLDVRYGGKFKNDPSECNHGGQYQHCNYNASCADGPAMFKEQTVDDRGDSVDVCATMKNWNNGYGRCGWMSVWGLKKK